MRTRLRLLAAVLGTLLLASLWPSQGLAQELPLTAGTIVTTNASIGTVTITDARGVTAQYRIAAGAELIVYARAARPADLLPGMSVWFYAREGEIVLLTAPGEWQAVPPQVGSMRTRVAGRLQYVDHASVGVILADGTAVVYSRTSETRAFRDGAPVAIGSLYPGDTVTLTFTDPGLTYLTRIEVQSARAPRADLYRGRLQSVSLPRQELVLQGTERLVQGVWQPADDWLRLPLAVGAGLYLQGEAADLATAGRQGIGQMVYAAVAPATDVGPTALKATIVPRHSLLFTATPAGVSYGKGEIVFPGEYGSVTTGDSTILIRNGRLVDFFGLSADGSYTVALASPPGTGLPDAAWQTPIGTPAQFAAAAVQDTYMPRGLSLYLGEVESVGGGQVTLRYPRHFEPYQFETVSNHWSARVTLNYGLALSGRDWRSTQGGKQLSRLDLDRQPGLSTWHPDRLHGSWVMAASLGGEIVALDVFPGVPDGTGATPNLMAPIVTAATVTSASVDEIVLNAPVAWNALAKRWEPDNLSWALDVSPNTVWLGPDGRINPGEVKPGTTVTVFRSVTDVYVIIVR